MTDTTKPEAIDDLDDEMPETDFSKAEVGKFYRSNATSHIPFYLDQDVQKWLIEKAAGKGIEARDIASELLRHCMQIEAAMK